MPQSPYLLLEHVVQSQASKEVTLNTSLNEMERAVCEVVSISVAGGAGTSTLTDSEARSAVIILTGALTGDRNVVVPSRDKPYIIHNTTTGAFLITVKTSGGSGVIVEQGFKAMLYCDATNVVELSGTPLRTYRTGTGAFTVRITDQLIYCDATGGNVTATLPAASVCLGRKFTFIRVDTSANTCTIQRAGADDINNAATSKTITNVIGTALEVTGYSSSRFLAQTLAAA